MDDATKLEPDAGLRFGDTLVIDPTSVGPNTARDVRAAGDDDAHGYALPAGTVDPFDNSQPTTHQRHAGRSPWKVARDAVRVETAKLDPKAKTPPAPKTGGGDEAQYTPAPKYETAADVARIQAASRQLLLHMTPERRIEVMENMQELATGGSPPPEGMTLERRLELLHLWPMPGYTAQIQAAEFLRKLVEGCEKSVLESGTSGRPTTQVNTQINVGDAVMPAQVERWLRGLVGGDDVE